MERLALMLDDTQAPMVITQQRLRERLPRCGVEVLLLDSEGEAAAQWAGHDPVRVARPDDLAYVIYTSGTTGKPRGVAIAHRAVCNHMLWMLSAFPLGAEDRVLQRAPASFDACVWELWAPLLAGAASIMMPPSEQADDAAIAATIRRHEVTVIGVVPSLLQVLLDEKRLEACGTPQARLLW